MRYNSPRACVSQCSMSAEVCRGLRESVWLEQSKYQQAETKYQEALAQRHSGLTVLGKAVTTSPTKSGLSDSIEATIGIIQKSLSSNPQSSHRADLEQRVTSLERENTQLKKDLALLVGRVSALEARLGGGGGGAVEKIPVASSNEDDFDPFGSDEEDEEEAQRLKERLVKEYQEKKSKKPAVVAKSSIILDVKPWGTETDMAEVEQLVRGISTEGLVWGASKLVPVAYGIVKLQITCVVEDEKVGTDFLEETITAFEDHVQSVDVVAFNKI